MKTSVTPFILAGLLAGSLAAGAAGPGYDNTPHLPGGAWRVHDSARPHPPVVVPVTPGEGEKPDRPPSDAIVLFDGTDLSSWRGEDRIKKDGKVVEVREREARWKIENGYMEVNRTGDIFTREFFASCQLHLEWAAPAGVSKDGQKRGNSGVFFMKRYEVQILDSFDNATYADGQAAAIYGQYPPLVNACRAPGEWQVYDIVFEAPVFEGDKLVKPAYVTVFHNGVLVQPHRELLGPTSHKRVASYTPHPERDALKFQDHGDPVRFRNIWIRPLDTVDP